MQPSKESTKQSTSCITQFGSRLLKVCGVALVAGLRLMAAGYWLLVSVFITGEKLFLHKFANDKRPEASGQ